MHSIPTTRFTIPFFLPLFLLLVWGCSFSAGDACEYMECGLHGECVEGDCACDAGYEGVACETAMNAKFSGSYTASEQCAMTGDTHYLLQVAPLAGTVDRIAVTGLLMVPQSTVTGGIGWDGMQFTMPLQAVGMTGFEVAGEGMASYDGAEINLSYFLFNQGETIPIDSCRVILQG